MGSTLKRFNSIRRTDDVTDRASSEAIAGAVAASETQEQFQSFFLSRLRQVIFGEGAEEHWYDDPFSAGTLSLKELSNLQLLALQIPNVRVGVTLIGALDGHNRTFRTSPERFIHDPGGSGATIELWHNGRRLIQARGTHREWGDFWVEESAGPGTGYDTVNLLTFSPVGRSSLLANYYRAL